MGMSVPSMTMTMTMAMTVAMTVTVTFSFGCDFFRIVLVINLDNTVLLFETEVDADLYRFPGKWHICLAALDLGVQNVLSSAQAPYMQSFNLDSITESLERALDVLLVDGGGSTLHENVHAATQCLVARGDDENREKKGAGWVDVF